MSSATSINRDSITITDIERKTFAVKSFVSSKTYAVSLGSDEHFPSCQCDDRARILLPCKHLFAVIEHVDGITWESLSSKYRASPYLNLDSAVIEGDSAAFEVGDDEGDVDAADAAADNQYVLLAPIAKPRYPKRSKAAACRELLEQIRFCFFYLSLFQVGEHITIVS